MTRYYIYLVLGIFDRQIPKEDSVSGLLLFHDLHLNFDSSYFCYIYFLSLPGQVLSSSLVSAL